MSETGREYIRQAIADFWGERCPAFDDDCPTCLAWTAFDAAQPVTSEQHISDELVDAIGEIFHGRHERGWVSWPLMTGDEQKAQVRVALAAQPILPMAAENEKLRQIISDCASALPNGAFVSPAASIEFMAKLPGEISSVVASPITEKVAEVWAEAQAGHAAARENFLTMQGAAAELLKRAQKAEAARDAAEIAENETKDLFWAVYPEYLRMGGAPVATPPTSSEGKP